MITGREPNIRRRLAPEVRAREEARQRKAEDNYSAEHEVTEQQLFRKTLLDLRREGRLYFLNPRSDQPSTIEVGHPDFTIWFKDHPATVFIEMKVPGGKLTLAQKSRLAELRALGDHVHCYVAWHNIQAEKIIQFYLSVALETKGPNDRPIAGEAASQDNQGMAIRRDVQATASSSATAHDVARTLRQDSANGDLP